MTTLDKIYKEILVLPLDQKLTLANKILASSEPSENIEVSIEWDKEIKKRINKYDKGLSKTISLKKVFANLDSRLKI
jgi:hypothetical protein